ncbi:MAG: hypothetical protein ACRYFX_17255 [Janthinobacterium lividum]
MKASIFATFAATALLAATSAFATPAFDHDGPRDRRNDNYGYAPNHRVTREEIARWEAARHNDHFDHNQNYGFDRDHRATREEQRRWEQAHNYGFAPDHRVTPQERARWEASYRR